MSNSFVKQLFIIITIILHSSISGITINRYLDKNTFYIGYSFRFFI
jgi:hypothetical protein